MGSIIDHSPPPRYDGTPISHTLPAGTTLWRVHSRKYEAAEFNPACADEHFGGGRFDGTKADPYPYYYGGETPETALCETLLTGIPRDERGHRTLQRAAVRGRSLSAVTIVKPLFLVSLLDGPALAAVAQSSWLLYAEGAEYARTRAISHWIRKQAEWAQGLIWHSSRDPNRTSVVLFGDRKDTVTALAPEPSRQIDLDNAAGAAWVSDLLAPYHVTLRPPRRTESRG